MAAQSGSTAADASSPKRGNRQKLLDGAVACIFDKGYARTTARDIAGAAGVSLAAIGYHFGSTEQLLNEAMIYGIDRWSAQLRIQQEATLAASEPGTLEHISAIWSSLLEHFDEQRPLWAATFEAFGQIQARPELRAVITEAQHDGRADLARQMLGPAADQDPQAARAVGSVFYALWVGTLAQYLIDRDSAPTVAELTDGLRRITDALNGRTDGER
jgi:AcrR family transcriptional regulator